MDSHTVKQLNLKTKNLKSKNIEAKNIEVKNIEAWKFWSLKIEVKLFIDRQNLNIFDFKF